MATIHEAAPVPASDPNQRAGTGQFEEIYGELQAVIAKLEDGGLSLEASVSLYEQGMALATRCEKILQESELRITRLAPEHAAFLAELQADSDPEL